MKNKPLRHKELNTFKFKPFAERISDIDIDIFHRVGHEYENDTDEEQCYFYKAVENWTQLNLTEGFENFKKEVKAHTLITLPQLILDKDHVVRVLLNHLKLQNALCLQPLLDITVAVAKDLRKEFYPYYKDFLDVLLDLLNTKDTEQLEWTFTCLAYLFKFLWRPLIKDISTVFDALLPLLSNNKPEYINNFAAGSFAFVTRKVKDLPTFLGHILKAVKSRKDGIEGCGKLFFEIIHGTDGQFHSCAENILPFLLESLLDDKYPQTILFEILEQIIESISVKIAPHKTTLLWTSLLNALTNLENSWRKLEKAETANCMELILKLIGQAVQYKNGKLLYDPKLLVQQMIKTLDCQNLPNAVLLNVTQIIILLLLSKNIRLTQEQSAGIIRKILALPQQEILLYFVDNVASFASFEILILPTFLKHCASNCLNSEYLKILTGTVLKKAPLAVSGINLSKWRKYPIDFIGSEDNLKIENIFLGHVINLDYAQITTYMNSVICLPHLLVTNLEDIQEKLTTNCKKLIGDIKELNPNENKSDLKKLLFLLNHTVECIIHIDASKKFCQENFDLFLDSLLPLSQDKNFVSALRIIDLFITVLEDNENFITMDVLKRLEDNIGQNFSSPYHEVRLLTSHIYTFFEDLPEFDINYLPESQTPKEKWRVFSICFKTESMESQVQTYREQIQNLEKFGFDRPQMLMCTRTPFRTLPLRYLCGVLYINFKLLWDPVVNIIATHAHGLDSSTFWSVYCQELKGVNERVQNENANVHEIDVMATDFAFLGDLYQDSQKLEAKVDFANYRLLLWKALSLFPDVAEARTRDVSELFLDFIEKEYTRNHSDVASNWNIKQNSPLKPAEEIAEEIAEDENIEENNENETSVTKKGGRVITQALLNMLKVFSKVRSPKSMYREPELYKLYLDLVQHKNPDIQKAAFDCIMTYKHKYLTPYQENLYRLINDKTFKHELVAFNINKDSEMIREEHRDDLIPFILRIVFSKMGSKTKLRTGGKGSSHLRRTLVLRFLAGCDEKDMLAFLKMSFNQYIQYLEEDPEIMTEKVSKNVNLERFVPPKRLQSTINMLGVILDQFGGFMGDDLLKFVLQVTLVIESMIKGALEQSSDVYSGYLSVLKTLRAATTKLLQKFFEKFDRYAWNNQEINAIFTVFVWPYLDKIDVDGAHSPTALLKLFAQWGSNPRYFPLLVKHHPEDENRYILPKIMNLLLNPKSNVSVVNCIQGMIEKMLSLEADEEDLQLALPQDNVLPVAQNILDRINLHDKINYGSCILLPHVSAILQKIQKKLESKSKHLNSTELFILTRISEFVWETDISDRTLSLLLPIVQKKCTSTGDNEEIVIQFLTTIHNLLNNVSAPQKHLKQISPLFGVVSTVSGRKLCCQILKLISTKCQEESLKVGSHLIDELNSWDPKWVEQPDFERRRNAVKAIEEAIDQEKVDLEIGVLIIFNCYYFLKTESDLSLRESANHCLKKLSQYIISTHRKHKEFDYVINETILNSIRSGMRSKNDDFRNECISWLGYLARECPDGHAVLKDLHQYTNKSDLALDCFENLVQFQAYRHARALLKFCRITKELKTSPSIRTLTQFILPLASFYLCTEKFSNKTSLIEASIDCIGTICRVLPWHQYEGLLKFYLGELRKKIDYQKQLVKVTVVILDAFHFDLSKGQVVTKTVSDSLESQESKSEENMDEDREIADKSNAETADKEASSVANENDNVDDSQVDLHIDEILEESSIQADDDEEDDVNKEAALPEDKELKICEKTIVLCKSTATRVIRVIQFALLPQLHRALAEMTHYESSHKLCRKNSRNEREDEELLRVPISLALVKLLQRLPKEILDSNIPGIFMKMCSFLKSPLDSVRRITRETLQKIMQTLGPEYLPKLLNEMTSLLNRGFQVHVLVYTTHSILGCLKDSYRPTDIDKVLLTVLDLCHVDLFGSLSDEREIGKIAVKTSEAKQTKSFDTFQILAQYITDKCLMDLILPLKNVIQTSHSFKTVLKAHECLRHVALGLVDNEFISVENLLKFAYGTASESIPGLILGQNKSAAAKTKEREKLLTPRTDCFIIPKAPVGRSGFRQNSVKISVTTNAHLLVEFGLRLCFLLLKREKVKDEEYKCFLDPFVPIFKNCLQSKHVKLSTITLQCLSWIMKYDLPSMQQHVQDIAKSTFAILHKYAAAGLSKGDNFDLVVASFKAMAVLVRDVRYYTINTEQLKILLLYAEQDIHDHDRQATAFNLLKAIISRKLIVPEMHQVMSKVAELSVTSELSYIRTQSRMVFHKYLMDYPLGGALEKHLAFYLSQMDYELQYGRESAVEMIKALISSFPMRMLKDHSGMLLVSLGARLVNEEVSECKKMVAECLSSMLNRLEKTDRDPLYDIIILWMKDNNLTHRQLAAQLCGILITIEKSSFETRLPILMPIVLKQFGIKNTKLQRIDTDINNEERTEEMSRIKDHYLFQTLQMLLKLCAQCPSFLKGAYIKNLSQHIQTLLGYPHDWVRLTAAQFIGFVLSGTDIERLATLIVSNKTDADSDKYLFNDPLNMVKSLTLDLCDQLQPGSVKNELAEQVIKNLVFIARVLENVPMNKETSDGQENKINLLWLTKRMRKIVNNEVVEAPTSTILRNEVFKWIAGVSAVLDLDNISKVLPHLLAPLVREMITTEESNAPLRQLAKEVANLIKAKVGMDAYTATVSKLQQTLTVRRADRKRSRTQLAVTDPEVFAKKKIKRQDKKKESKKRKFAEKKGVKRNFKKRKIMDLEGDA